LTPLKFSHAPQSDARAVQRKKVRAMRMVMGISTSNNHPRSPWAAITVFCLAAAG
jgi:hypothetical protein